MFTAFYSFTTWFYSGPQQHVDCNSLHLTHGVSRETYVSNGWKHRAKIRRSFSWGNTSKMQSVEEKTGVSCPSVASLGCSVGVLIGSFQWVKHIWTYLIEHWIFSMERKRVDMVTNQLLGHVFKTHVRPGLRGLESPQRPGCSNRQWLPACSS